MIGGVNYASSQIASVYNSNSQQLAATLTKIASGKKFQSAAEDLTGFLRAQNLNVDIGGYERVREDLTAFKTYTSAAVQASSSLYESMTEMKDIAEQYAGTDVAEVDLRAQLTADFNALKTEVSKTIESTYVDGDLITDTTDTVRVVNLDPAGDQTLEMTFTDLGDVSALSVSDVVTAAGGLDEQISSTLTFMSEAKSFDAIADQQLNLTNTIINSKKAVMSLITDIDEAEETNKALDLSIRQQAAMSMMSQANMSRQAVMKLYS